MNKYEELCKEWLKGCSNTLCNYQEDCKPCTDAFLKAVKEAVKEDNYFRLNFYCSDFKK